MTEVLFWCKATKTKSLRDGNNVFESEMKKNGTKMLQDLVSGH